MVLHPRCSAVFGLALQLCMHQIMQREIPGGKFSRPVFICEVQAALQFERHRDLG